MDQTEIRTFRFMLLLVLLATAVSRGADARSPEKKIRIVLAGDSTVTDTSGWGKGFASCFDDKVEVINLARSGRSSKSFIAEGHWKKCLDLKPDYLLIQFGHNDQKLFDPTRGTEPQTTYRQFMTQFVDEARAAGIQPILVTSLSRRQWGPDGKIRSTLIPYVDVVKAISTGKTVPLIDLHARSIELYEKLGKDGVKPLEPTTQPTAKNSKTSKDAKPQQPATAPSLVHDGTHLNAKGSATIGPIVAEEMKKVVPAVATHIKCQS